MYGEEGHTLVPNQRMWLSLSTWCPANGLSSFRNHRDVESVGMLDTGAEVMIVRFGE